MKNFRLYYFCKYHPTQWQGSHEFKASDIKEARAYSIKWLQDHGGIEGLEWGFKEI
jgi:hypothetical protein